MGNKQKPGRKKVAPAEKVVLVGFYTKKRHIEEKGGMVAVREKCKELIES